MTDRRNIVGKYKEDFVRFIPAKPLSDHEQKMIDDFLAKKKSAENEKQNESCKDMRNDKRL